MEINILFVLMGKWDKLYVWAGLLCPVPMQFCARTS